MYAGEPGVIVSDLCHKRNIFPPPCAHPAPLLEDLLDCEVELSLSLSLLFPAPLLEDLLDCEVLLAELLLFLFCFSTHPAPLLEDLLDCKVLLAELSLFKLSISTQDILFSFLFCPHNHFYLTSACDFFLSLFSSLSFLEIFDNIISIVSFDTITSIVF